MLTNTSHIIYVIVSPILSTCFIVLNMATIYVFCKKLKLQPVCTILIMNICACDIFVCLISNTFYLYNLLDLNYAWRTGAFGCKLFKFLTMLTNVAQIYFLCFLTADRLRRLVHATSAQWIKSHAIAFMICGWVAAFILTSPWLALYDEKKQTLYSKDHNQTLVVNVQCKPVRQTGYENVASTCVLFVVGYALPASFVVYAALRTKQFMWKRRQSIHITMTSNFVTRMKNQLSLTFNLTAILFLLVWTPFFLLSVLDLSLGLVGRKDLIHVNFTLRCSLLILGSAKPVIYLICLDKFRSCFSFRALRSSTTTSVLTELPPSKPVQSPAKCDRNPCSPPDNTDKWCYKITESSV